MLVPGRDVEDIAIGTRNRLDFLEARSDVKVMRYISRINIVAPSDVFHPQNRGIGASRLIFHGSRCSRETNHERSAIAYPRARPNTYAGDRQNVVVDFRRRIDPRRCAHFTYMSLFCIRERALTITRPQPRRCPGRHRDVVRRRRVGRSRER